MDEGYCSKCGKRVSVPTDLGICEYAPNCGPFRSENTVRDDVLFHDRRGWWPLPGW